MHNQTFKLPGNGLSCDKCGGVLARVSRTVKSPGFLTRERICEECGTLNTTSERVINTRQRRGFFTSPCEET